MLKKLILLIGAPGSGKTTDGSSIAKNHSDITHYSTGDLLKSEVEKETKLGKINKGFIESGELVPTDIVIDTIVGAVRNAPTDIVLLDGFPRKEKQMKFFADCLNNVDGIELSSVIEIRVSEDVARERVLGGAESKSEDLFNNTMKIYQETIAEIEEFYNQNNLLKVINGEQEMNVVVEEIDTFLQQQIALLPA
ncbi:MAG: adenylate kinase [Sulfurovum sp.]|uniref:adenylate kinase n=1 Tax=Sulfurovum sp. TaxID=1969726 RepID=UPI002867E4E5|nr:adenylate kinase [Sulfurovum sp.]MCO4844917.1 adenylate kinase [Sulfurovum sp.]